MRRFTITYKDFQLLTSTQLSNIRNAMKRCNITMAVVERSFEQEIHFISEKELNHLDIFTIGEIVGINRGYNGLNTK